MTRAPPADRRLGMLRAAAWLTLAAESLAALLWPVLAALCVLASVALLGIPALLPGWLHLVLGLAALCGLALLMGRALRQVRLPGSRACERRLERDSGLHHRPFATLRDRPAQAGGHGLWQLHQARARLAVNQLRLKPPHARLAEHDPLALRAACLVLLVASLVVAGPQAWPRLVGAVLPGVSWSLMGPPPVIQAWIQPPAYTGLPPIFLPGTGGDVTAPAGSRLTLSVTGARPHISLAGTKIAVETLGQDSFQASALLTKPGLLRVGGRFSRLAGWMLTLLDNPPPTAAWTRLPGRAGTSSSVSLPWHVAQRWGVAALEAEIRPKGRADLPALQIPLPLPGTPKQASGAASPDLASSPYAGLTVTGSLHVRDVSGQAGQGAPADFVLPARDFHHPVARAVADLRRRLALHPDRPDMAAADLDALAQPPVQPPVPGLSAAGVTLNMEAAAAVLAGRPDAASIEQVQGRLWMLALALDGALPDAAGAALEEARENLRRGLDDHAHGRLSDRELSQKLQALRQALDKRLQEMAQQAMKQGALEHFNPQSQHLSSGAMDHAIERLERALKEGRMEDARQAMAQLNRMMDQLKTAHIMTKEEAQQQEQQQKKGRQQAGAVQDMVQRETTLLDHAQVRAPRPPPSLGPPAQALQSFGLGNLLPDLSPPDLVPPSETQEPGTEAPSPPGAQAPTAPHFDDDAARSQLSDARTQRALHRSLDVLKQAMTASGQKPPRRLDDASGAMQDAAGALARHDDPQARDAVGRAIAALQQGGKEMARDAQGQGGSAGLQLSLQPGGQSGQGGQGEADGEDGSGDSHGSGRKDPFGRQVDGNGTVADDPNLRVPDEMEQGRSRAIQDELRRRGADRGRPKQELDYIDRLLKPF